MQKEILLVRTSLSSARCNPTGGSADYNHLAEKARLLIAWNKLLHEIFPEMFEEHVAGKKIKFRAMNKRSLLMELKSGQMFLELELQSSIDPCSFMPFQILS